MIPRGDYRGGTECCLARIVGRCPGYDVGLTPGWIGDPRMVGRPGPRRVRLFDLGYIVFWVTRSDFDCDHLAFILPTLLAR
jgi:hypothetical protein